MLKNAMLKKVFASAVLAGLVAAVPTAAQGSMSITEWMYTGGVGEFVEFTNVGATPIDMTGWSYDDDSRLPGVLDLSPFGTVQGGESVIITEADAATFRTSWALDASVKVIGNYTNNLGRNDEINLFDGTALADRLTYGDQNFPGTIRTQDASGNPISLAALGANDPSQWVSSSVGDDYGSYVGGGATANPGAFTVVPEPGAVTLLALSAAGLAIARRRFATRRGK